MADTVFRVQVGAQVQTSTVTLRSDIQNILNDIGKQSPPKITVGLAKTATKTRLTTDLNDLLTKQNIGITLGLKGGGSLRGSSGAKIAKELIGITSQLSQHQAAKITLHLNTAATQKAMLAELKKLDLGVNITPRENKKKSATATPAKYGPAWQAEPAHPTAQTYEAAGEAAKRVAFQVQAAAGSAGLLRQALLGVAQTPTPDYTKVSGQVTNIADETGRWAAEQQAARKEYEATVQKAATLQKEIYDLQRKQAATSSGDADYKALQEIIERKTATLDALLHGYLSSASAQSRGDTMSGLNAEIQAVKKVSDAWDQYSIACAKAEKSKQSANKRQETTTQELNQDIADAIRKAKLELNTAVPAGVEYSEKLEHLQQRALSGGWSFKKFSTELSVWRHHAEEAGAMAETAGQKFSRMLGDKIGYGAIALVLTKVRQALGQIYTNVVNLDTAMTELKKVTDETDATYQKFLTNAGARARELGATITDTVNATASFARLGYGIEDASKLADAAVVYKHVGDGIESIDQASESIIATMQAFGVQAQDVMTIVDKFNEVGNREAITSAGIGDAMLRSASAMKAANNSLDETIALIAAANTVVQDPVKVGTTMKTISMFLRAAKTEAEEAGESTDGMAESVSKLREELLALTGKRVDIMADDKTFKSTYQIMKEMSQVWHDLSDVSQANILEKLGGKRNSNVVAALVENFAVAEKSLKESQDSAGSALEENEKYLDSINGKLDRLRASWEQLSNSLLGNEVIKKLIDALRAVLDFFNKIDEATNGASSTIITLVSTITMLNAVLTAFKFKAEDKTSLLGGLINGLSGHGVFQANLFAKVIKKLKVSVVGLYAAFNVGKSATGTFIGGLAGIVKAANPAVVALVAISAAVGAVYALYRHFKPESIKELGAKAEELQEDINDLSSSIETANERIKELQQLADNGTISLVEQDELDRLKDQNELLQTQLDLKQALLDANNQKKAAAARGEYDTFFKNYGEAVSATEQNAAQDVAYNGDSPGHYASNAKASASQKFDEKRAEIIEYDRQIRELTASMVNMTEAEAEKAEKKLQELNDKRADALTKLGEIAEPLQDILSSLDPEVDADKIQQIKLLTYQIEYLSGDAAALKKIWDSIWGDEDSSPGIKKLKSDLESAATAQAEFNEELKKHQSNVDMTNRPHIEVTQDMVNTGMWDESDIGNHSTVNSFTFTAEEFGGKSTQAILVTPILPDGTYFKSQYDLEKYLEGLMNGDGTFDVSKDGKGIVMGVFDEGSVDASVEEADRYAEVAHNVNAAFDALLESDTFQQFRTEMEAIGYDMSNVSAGDLAKMFEQLQPAVDPATQSLKGLTEALEKLAAKSALIKSAQKELTSSGQLSVSTLSSIVEKFPALEENVSLYIAGMKTGKELIADLSAAYKTEADAYRESMAKKLETSATFYEKLPAKQKKLIDDLAEAYKVDLGNFKTIEQAKLNFQAEIIRKLALNYSEYAGASLATLKRSRTDIAMMVARTKNNPIYTQEQHDSFKMRLAEIDAAIKAIEDGNKRLDGLINGNLETWNPDKFTDKDKSGSKSDDYKKSVQEKIDALKHRLQMEEITAEQYYDGLEAIEKKYYKDSAAHTKKYASEIRSIDEELFSGRRQIAESWLQYQEKRAAKEAASGNYAGQQKVLGGMLEKVKQMISDAYAYGLTEASDYVQTLHDKLSSLQDDLLSAVQSPFEKYISYMDDFDLWDDIVVDAKPVKKMANSLQDVSKILGTIPVEKASDAMQKFASGTDDAAKSMKGLISELGKLSKLDTLKLQLQAIDQQYQAGLLSWEKYVDAHNKVAKSIYDTQRDSLQTILDLTMEMIKQEAEDQVDAIEKQEKAYKKIIDLKKQLLQDADDEADHEEEVAEKTKEIAELQSKIAQLSLDDSREAAAKKASLAEELQKKQKELADLQRDYALDQTIDSLDKSQEAFENEKDAEKDAAKKAVDSWAKLYEKAIKRINGDWDGLYKDLMAYEKEHRDSIDGPDSLVSAWHSATSAMKEYNNSFEDAYKNAPNDAINPNAPQSPEAQAILKKMKANSDLAKSLGTSKTPDGRNLHEENNQLAAQYYALTGQKLTYNNGWRNEHGDPAYDVTAKPNTGTQSKPQGSSGGSAYEATVKKYSSPPSGTLKEGSTGAGVKWLQYYLKQLGLFPYDVDGQFYSRTKNALQQFQRRAKINPDGIYGKNTRAVLPKFHTGGIVGNSGAINDHEVLALLKKGEWVLDDTRKRNLKELFSNLKVAASGLMSSTAMSRMQTMRPAAVASGGDTFAPHIEVSIQHNGQMTDKDAKQYGNMVANTALEQLRTAFVKRGKA